MLRFCRRLVGIDRKNREKGQSTAEYIIIVALIAIASIAVITVFGDKIRALFAGASAQLEGDEDATPSDFDTGDDAGDEVEKSLTEW